MSTVLIIERIENGEAQFLARLDQDSILIGREPRPSGISVPNFSISGTHGEFKRYGHYWFYKDLGSTNGSYLEERQIPAGRLHLVKHAEHLLLANSPVRLSLEFNSHENDIDLLGLPSLVAFWNDQLVGDLSLAAGEEQELGGPESVLRLTSMFNHENHMRFYTNNEGSYIQVVKSQLPVMLNDEVLVGAVELLDRDEIKCGDFSAIFNDGYHEMNISDAVSNQGTYVEPSAVMHPAPVPLEDTPQAKRFTGAFGRLPTETEDSEDENRFSTASLYAGRGSFGTNMPAENNQSSLLEDKIIIGIGALLMLVIFILLIVFVLS